MTVLRLKMLRAEITEEVLDQIGEFTETVLAERHTPLLAGALRYHADALSVAPGYLGPAAPDPSRSYLRETTLFAEVFPTDHGVVALEVGRTEGGFVLGEDERPIPTPREPRLTLYGIGSEQIAEPLNEIGRLIGERFDVGMEEHQYRSDKFRRLTSEGRTSPDAPSADERNSARVLSDDAVRRAALGIATSGGLLRNDLPKHLDDDADRSEEIERRLRESGLVEVELIVTCKQRSTQVARAPTRDALEEMARNGLKCACGRDVLRERIDEALTLNDHGRKMLNGSFWMTVLVMTELEEMGVGLDRMLVEEISGGDEMDFFVDISGELALLELKDKEFSLGNAYSFGSKTGIFHPEHPVIVTSAYVGNDAKEHFRQAAMARRSARRFSDDEENGEIQYVEGVATLREELQRLVGAVYERDAADILGRLLPHAAPAGGGVIAGLKATFEGGTGGAGATSAAARTGMTPG